MKSFQFHAIMPIDRFSKAANKKYLHDPFTRSWLKKIAHNGGSCEVFALTTPAYWIQAWRPSRLGIGTVIGAPGYFTPVQHSIEWLAKRTVRISESLARQLHPELFTYLESNP